MRETVEENAEELKQLDALRPSSQLMVLEVLWNHRAFLVKCSFVGMIIATILAFVIPKEYKSTAQLMPEDSGGMTSTSLMALAAGTSVQSLLARAYNPLSTKSENSTFLGILSSQTAQDDIINRFDLRRVYGLRLYKDARKRLSANTEIGEDKKSENILITVEDRDPTRARNIVAAYIDELNKLNAQDSTSAARRERMFLEGRIKELQAEFDQASRELSEFSSRNATIDVQSQATAMLQSQARLQESLTLTLSELRGLQTTYAQDNVRVRALQARVDELESQLRKLNGVDEKTTDNSGVHLDDGEMFPSIRQLPLLGSRYTDLYLRFTVTQALFGILTKEYEMAKMEEAREIPTVRVLDPPSFPEEKSFPPRTQMVIGGALLFFIGSGVWVIGQSLWELYPTTGFKAVLLGILRDAQNDRAHLLHRLGRRKSKPTTEIPY